MGRDAEARSDANQALWNGVARLLDRNGLTHGARGNRAGDFIVELPDDTTVLIACQRAASFTTDASFHRWARRLDVVGFDQIWIVANLPVSKRVARLISSYTNVSLLSLKALESRILTSIPPSAKRKALAQVVSKARSNGKHVLLLAASLGLLIEEKLASLREELPNTQKGSKVRDKQIAEFEVLQKRVEELEEAVAEFTKGRVKESTLASATYSFSDGIQDWWKHSHDNIITTSFGMTIFVLGTAICTQLGVPAKEAAFLSAALAGGASLPAALKKLSKVRKAGE